MIQPFLYAITFFVLTVCTVITEDLPHIIMLIMFYVWIAQFYFDVLILMLGKKYIKTSIKRNVYNGNYNSILKVIDTLTIAGCSIVLSYYNFDVLSLLTMGCAALLVLNYLGIQESAH